MNPKNLKMLPVAMFVSLFIFSCSGGKMDKQQSNFDSIKDVPNTVWEKLSKKKIYFGHQSVGFNIIDGIYDVMKENPEIKLNIVETTDRTDFESGLLAHSTVGKNTDPKSKIDEFAKNIDGGIGKIADAAALKFCYVDITSETDVEKVFGAYKGQVEKLRASYPNLAIIHFTAPLTGRQTGWKASIKKIIGREIDGATDNIKRFEYNELLVNEFDGKDPIFDIAKIESTFTDGTRSSFEKDGETYYSMVPEYTYDGGHLNELGRKRVAERFLIFLSNLS
jgi:hypothetical protein